MKKLITFLLFTLALNAQSEPLIPIVLSPGSQPTPSGGQFFPNTCNGNAYFLVEKQINAWVVKTYLFIGANAPAVDAWILTDTVRNGQNDIIGEVHQVTSVHPFYPDLRYWERERDFGKDAVYVGKAWIMAICYPYVTPYPRTYNGSIEPYAILYTRPTP